MDLIPQYRRAEQAPRKGMEKPGIKEFSGDENNLYGTKFQQPIRDRMPTVAGRKKIGSIKFSKSGKQR